MKTYTILTPYVIFNINTGGQKKEYALKKGDTVELPENDIAVRALLARRQIIETAANTKVKEPEVDNLKSKTTKKQK
jgi:hypothetical protein